MSSRSAVADIGMTAACDNCIADLPVPPSDTWETAMTADWPLQSYLELGPLKESVRTARLHAAQVIWEWGLSDLRFACELIVDELISNAVRASQALGQFTPVRLWLLSDKEKVLIMVWDASPLPPLPAADFGPLAEGGRGLCLVGEASEQWSWFYTFGGGKAVWALCGEAFG